MSQAKIRSLLVRPYQSADLAFPVPGVLEWENPKDAKLGARISQYKPEISLFPSFEGPGKVGADILDSTKIVSALAGGTGKALFGLRNHTLRAELDEALRRHENAILQRYAHTPKIVEAMATLYPAITDTTVWPPKVSDSAADWASVTRLKPASVLGRLRAMSDAINVRFEKLKTAYGSEDLLKELASVSDPEGEFTTTTHANGYPTFSVQQQTINPGKTTINDSAGAAYQTISYEPTTSVPDLKDAEGWKDWEPNPKKMQTSTTTYKAKKFKTKTRSDLAAFPHRPTENTASFLRSQLDLLQQSLQEFLFSLSVSSVKDVMDNEREIIELSVRKMQIQLALSYLVPPFDGVVSAVYKDPGESVAPGEPVIRVDDDSRLYLVGTINYRGLLAVDTPPQQGALTIVTKSLFENQQVARIENVAIRSVRGHDADNDEWDVVLECENKAMGGGSTLKLPLNFHFDRDDTVVEIP